MRRREFALGVLTAAIGRAGWAQAPGRQYRVAIAAILPVDSVSETGDPAWTHFFRTLGRFGYAEGQNLIVERYSADGDPGRSAEIAERAIAVKPDLIVAQTSPIALALKARTTSIPLIVIDGDPIATGLTSNLARPGGNLTGVSVDAGVEIYGKRLQILKELVPAAARVAFIALSGSWDGSGGRDLREAGRQMGIELIKASPPAITADNIQRLFATFAEQQVDGAVLSPVGFEAQSDLIVTLADKNRLPVIYPTREYVAAGGLIAYATTSEEPAEHLADQVRQVLAGTNPGDIPYYQATKLGLAINLGTARRLGLRIPQPLIDRADQIVE